MRTALSLPFHTTTGDEQHSRAASQQLALRFLLNPREFQADSNDPTALGAVVCERTWLEGPAGAQGAVGTGQLETIPASLALVSIGYQGVALPGTEEWFDDTSGTYRHVRGKVADRSSNGAAAVYTAGWIKRGPTGIIGSNIPDARETAQTIVADWERECSKGTELSTTETEDLASLLRQRSVRVVDWAGVQQIHAAEYANRRHEEQPREKVTELEELLRIAGV